MKKLSMSDVMMLSILVVCCVLTAVFMGLYINNYEIKNRVNAQQPIRVYTDADILESRLIVSDHDKRVGGISKQLSNCLTFDRGQCYYNVYLERGFNSNDVVMGGDGILRLSLEYDNDIQKHRDIAKKPLQIELGLPTK